MLWRGERARGARGGAMTFAERAESKGRGGSEVRKGEWW